MPKPQERDLDATKVIFSNWIETKLDGATDLDVELLGGPENTGFSNETISFNVSYKLEDTRIKTGMVLRFYPEGFFVFPDYDIHKQFLIMQKLADHDIKVPKVLWYEPSDEVFGTSFYVMEMASGDAPSDILRFIKRGGLLIPQKRSGKGFGGVGLSKWLKYTKLISPIKILNF